MINIHGKTDNSNDLFYRYKMHKMNVIAGKNNTTIIDNVGGVMKDLERDSPLLTKFFKQKLGTNIQIKKDKMIISKTLNITELEPILFDFIETHILCPKCKLPETNISFDKKDKSKVMFNCKACGLTQF